MREKKEAKLVKRKSENIKTPAKLKAHISFTSHERIKCKSTVSFSNAVEVTKWRWKNKTIIDDFGDSPLIWNVKN